MKKILFVLALLVSTFFVSSTFADQNSFEVRVRGKGYLGIELPDGSLAYTKSAVISPDEQGVLTTEDGFHLNPSVTVNTAATSRRIGIDGYVVAIAPQASSWTAEGVLVVYSFYDPSKLKPIGAGLYRSTSGSNPVLQGSAANSGFGTIEITE
jgi:flagellar basal-body rod protein FlgG